MSGIGLHVVAWACMSGMGLNEWHGFAYTAKSRIGLMTCRRGNDVRHICSVDSLAPPPLCFPAPPLQSVRPFPQPLTW